MSPRRKCSWQHALPSCKYCEVTWFLWAATHKHSCEQYLWQLIVEIQVDFFLQHSIPDVNWKVFLHLRETFTFSKAVLWYNPTIN